MANIPTTFSTPRAVNPSLKQSFYLNLLKSVAFFLHFYLSLGQFILCPDLVSYSRFYHLFDAEI